MENPRTADQLAAAEVQPSDHLPDRPKLENARFGAQHPPAASRVERIMGH
jgi:hypothetical protein